MRIYCKTNKQYYGSMRQAGKVLNLSHSHISECVNKKNVSTKGYEFRKLNFLEKLLFWVADVIK